MQIREIKYTTIKITKVDLGEVGGGVDQNTL